MARTELGRSVVLGNATYNARMLDHPTKPLKTNLYQSLFDAVNFCFSYL